jgi:hypothetical protein
VNLKKKPGLSPFLKYHVAWVLGALFLWIAGNNSATAEISIEPYIQGGVLYDSNPFFLSSNQNPESAWGTIFDLRLPIELRTPRASITLDPRLFYSFYPDDEFEGAELRDEYLTGRASWMSRQSSIGASYGYTDLSLRTSEFDAAGAGQTRFSRDDTQRRGYFQPYWQYQFSPRNSLTLNGGYEEVRYDEKFVSRRFNYDYTSAAAAVRHAFSARHNLSLRAQFTKFDSENNNLRITNDSETNSLSLIYDYSWSDTAQVSADIGWARTKNEVTRPNNVDPITGPYCEPAFIPIFPCETKSDSTNFVGNVTVTKQSEKTEYKVVLGQSITPNSNGAEVLRFSIDASARKKFSDRVNGRLAMLAFTQNDVGDSVRDFERDYIRVLLRLNYLVRKNWSLYGAYVHTFNDENFALSSARTVRNNSLSMGITYQGDGWRW